MNKPAVLFDRLPDCCFELGFDYPDKDRFLLVGPFGLDVFLYRVS